MSSEQPLLGMRILVVEDDFYLATDEKSLLESAGAKVIGPSADPGEACRLLEQGPVDCALVDVNLGDGPSYTVAAALRERNVPFLFTTGYGALSIPEELWDVPRLEKPFNDHELLSTVERLLPAGGLKGPSG